MTESTVREQLRTNLFSLDGTNPAEDLAGRHPEQQMANPKCLRELEQKIHRESKNNCGNSELFMSNYTIKL